MECPNTGVFPAGITTSSRRRCLRDARERICRSRCPFVRKGGKVAGELRVFGSSFEIEAAAKAQDEHLKPGPRRWSMALVTAASPRDVTRCIISGFSVTQGQSSGNSLRDREPLRSRDPCCRTTSPRRETTPRWPGCDIPAGLRSDPTSRRDTACAFHSSPGYETPDWEASRYE